MIKLNLNINVHYKYTEYTVSYVIEFVHKIYIFSLTYKYFKLNAFRLKFNCDLQFGNLGATIVNLTFLNLCFQFCKYFLLSIFFNS